jgi:hypothetical protein
MARRAVANESANWRSGRDGERMIWRVRPREGEKARTRAISPRTLERRLLQVQRRAHRSLMMRTICFLFRRGSARKRRAPRSAA